MRSIYSLFVFTLIFSFFGVEAQQVRFSIELNQLGVQNFELPPRLDIVSHSHDHSSVDIVAPRETYEHLQKIGMAPKLIEVQKVQVQESYLNPREISEYLRVVAQKHPEFVHLEEIGRSLQGEPIWAVRLSFKDNLNQKPSIVFNGMHHAREVMTTEVTTDIIHYIVSNAGNIETPEVADWLAQLQIWVIPQMNPDGNWIVWNQDSWWRKNARGDGREVWGVDLNRNYPYRWGACRGSSNDKDSQTYRGDAEGSEPETQTVMKFAKRVNPVINISYHSYSELVISPYGCRGHVATESEILDSVGAEFAKRLVKDSGKGTYAYGPAWDELYPVDGDDISWLHQHLNILAYVVEIGSSSNGFQPDYDRWRDSMVLRQRAGWMYLLNRSMSGPQVRINFYDVQTGRPVEASVRIAGLNYQDEAARQSRNGFLVKMLPSGQHRLNVEAEGYLPTEVQVNIGDFPEFQKVYLQSK